jgi:hypothetical protein
MIISGSPVTRPGPGNLNAWHAILSDCCQAFGVKACMNVNLWLCRVLVGCAYIHAAHAVVRHPDGKRAFDVAQIVALGRSGKG